MRGHNDRKSQDESILRAPHLPFNRGVFCISGSQNRVEWDTGNQKSTLKQVQGKNQNGEIAVNEPLEVRGEVLVGLSALLKRDSPDKSPIESGLRSKWIVVSEWLEGLPLPEVVNRKSLTLNLIQGNRGEEIDIENLKSRLLEVGFRRVGTVEELGEFATRGGILDLWGYGMEYPCRIEFGGDEFVSIREFDPLLQTSIRSCESCDILPMNLRSGKASILDYLPKDALVVLDGVQDARCKMQDGRWKIIYLGEGYIENQRAKMKDGRWRIENGRVDVGAEPSYQGDIRLFISKIKDLKGPDKSPIASRFIGIHRDSLQLEYICGM